MKLDLLIELKSKTIYQVADERKVTPETIVFNIHQEVLASRKIYLKSDKTVLFDNVDIYKTEGAWMHSPERRSLMNYKNKMGML